MTSEASSDSAMKRGRTIEYSKKTIVDGYEIMC